VATGIFNLDRRVSELEMRHEEVLQLVERLIDHVLPQSFSEEYRAQNAEALRAWPDTRRGDA
jgi:hypothetical protein